MNYTPMKPRYIYLLFALLSAGLWGVMIPIIRYLIVNGVSPLFISIVRLWLGSLTLFLIVLLFKKKVDFRIQNKKSFFILTIFGITLNFILMHIGLQFTYSNTTILLAYTVPIWVLLFMFIFFKEKLSFLKIIAVLVSIIGIVFVFLGNTVKSQILSVSIGDVFELLSAVTFAFFIVGSANFLKLNQISNIDRLELLMKIFFFSAVFLTPALFFIDIRFTLIQMLIILGLGIFQTAVAHGLWYYSISKISPVTISLVFNLIIIFSFIISWLFLNEKFNFYILIGGILIVISIFISENRKFFLKLINKK